MDIKLKQQICESFWQKRMSLGDLEISGGEYSEYSIKNEALHPKPWTVKPGTSNIAAALKSQSIKFSGLTSSMVVVGFKGSGFQVATSLYACQHGANPFQEGLQLFLDGVWFCMSSKLKSTLIGALPASTWPVMLFTNLRRSHIQLWVWVHSLLSYAPFQINTWLNKVHPVLMLSFPWWCSASYRTWSNHLSDQIRRFPRNCKPENESSCSKSTKECACVDSTSNLANQTNKVS